MAAMLQQPLLSGDVVVLASNEHGGVLKCDGFFGDAPTLVPFHSASGLPLDAATDNDECCFVIEVCQSC